MHRRTGGVAMAMVVVMAGIGCAQRVSQPKAQPEAGHAGWTLVEPPLVRDPRFPRGHRVQSEAPLGHWSTVGDYPDVEHCDRAMRNRIDDTIDRAKVTSGSEAKHDLDVRRAVNAQCIQPK